MIMLNLGRKQLLDVIGFSLRCLSEVLVEYFEFLDVSMQVGKASSFEHVSRNEFL
ncbi:hypothetical protein J8M20_05590 [Pseudoalteromonas luteoviolacea]|uniref:hypothetical protein n=1 Tax=Pseudoalteromonas luteoviolacea TaxID=43657 RepID=UPI001B37D583|nr:hypothetical protein [Pseudoalteromonas luteoviolacea]MBQ4810797.1 hypothetical protein [Pseudoalteromonas luteoviolacea]